MLNLTPNTNTNTKTTPDWGADHTLQPIQAIFAARFAVKKIGHQHHDPIRETVGTGLLASLSQSNRTNPKPTLSRSIQLQRHQEPDNFSTLLHPPIETNPNPFGSRISRNSGRRASGSDSESVPRLRPAAPEQNKPKPAHQPKFPSRNASGTRRLFHLASPPDRSPKPAGSRILRNSVRRAAESIHLLQPAALEQNKPKFHHQPQTAQPKPKPQPNLALFSALRSPNRTNPNPQAVLKSIWGNVLNEAATKLQSSH